jgi:glycosyltransferase involved in cell wall biosynthesis
MQADTSPAPARGGTVIAVVTYRRNADLDFLLPLLQQEAASIEPPAGVLVVDNDPDAGARAIAEGHGAVYAHEPVPGIAAARNRALDEATAWRYLAFIDDDEHPEPGWLRALLATIAQTGAAAVAGAVVSEFEELPEEWVLASRLFERPRVATGTPVPAAATNNLILDLTQVLPRRFDERLGLVGGSDNLFTRQLVRDGLLLTWCDEAVVIDRVPAPRATREWVRRRAYRIGNSEIVVSLLLSTSSAERAAIRARAIVSGTVRMAVGLIQITYGAVFGDLRHRAGGSRLFNRGRGRVFAALGSTYAEYLRDDGPAAFRTRKK